MSDNDEDDQQQEAPPTKKQATPPTETVDAEVRLCKVEAKSETVRRKKQKCCSISNRDDNEGGLYELS
jgi:hypothetical protein